MASTFSASGSTQNPWCSQTGNITAPIQFKYPTITATTATAFTVDKSQSGTIFLLPSVGAAITLPTPVLAGPGFTCRFQMLANNATTAWAISSGTASTITGSLTNSATTTTFAQVIKAGVTTVSFSATTAILGDWINFTCDGTNYIISSYSGVATGLS